MADNNYVTKDSGARMEFETGSRRDTQEGKTRPDLIGPELLRRLGDLMARGAAKYGENNWRLGQKASRYYASMFRHMLQWAEGDDSEDHLAAIAFNVGGLMHLEKLMPEHLDHERYDLARRPQEIDLERRAKLKELIEDYGGTCKTSRSSHPNDAWADDAEIEKALQAILDFSQS
jgi:hypothetical protein